MKKKGLNMEQKRSLTGWAFLLPAALLIFVFCFYPMVQALILSFQKGTGSAVQPAGFANYVRILKDATFQQCLFNTIFYFVIQVPIMLILALILAQLLNSPDIKGKGIYRTMIFLPCATSLVSYSMIFKSLFANDGLVNRVLSTVGIPTVDWLQNAWAARWVIVIALVWRWTGYNMVFYLAGLQNIDYSIYEAARIDGASPLQQFVHLTIPLLKPTILLTAMMIPFAAIMIPMFRMFSTLKMVNTMTAFMLPSIATPFMIMMFRQASRSFPHDIIEAARIDGLSETGIFFRMFMPTMKSTYAAATIITFMGAWNNYLWPKVILQNNDAITMPMLVANLLGGYTVDYGMLMLGVFICTIPTAIIFFAFQKSFTEGITGAVK